MILKPGGANAATYTLAGLASFAVESLNATLDTTGMALGTSTACDVVFRDSAGLVIARSRSSNTITDGGTFEITFAPWLPDTADLGNQGFGYVNTTGLCATTLPPHGSVTVQPVDVLAIVRSFRMWVEDVADGAGELVAFGDWAYVPGPGA